jgi:predicted unusual protein kinase regulating ubiquinone biosynthesis (AarF/ABC1/UbiB family)
VEKDGDSGDGLHGIRRGIRRSVVSTGRLAVSATRLAARRAMGADGDTDGRLGESLARELDEMKGLAMKVGQILSYLDGVLPEATHEALRSLQRGNKPVAYERMAEVITTAFGEPVEALFERLDSRAVAAASIGQVYRASYAGRDVAVKVQYPGVRETVEGDVARLRSLARVASFATAVDGPAIVDELRERFLEECDYEREAANQNAFAAAFEREPATHIPRAVLERTRPSVLTTEWADGDGFYTFLESADDELRNSAALVLTRFAYRSLFELGTLNADPHPGNYLFAKDGGVVFLDFGCVRRFESAFVDAERRVARAVLDGRRADFRDAVVATGMVPSPSHFDFDIHWDMLSHQWQPYRERRFRFTPEYIARGATFSRPSNPNLRRLAIPPAWIWVQRMQSGLHAVLTRMHAEGPFRDVLERSLSASGRSDRRSRRDELSRRPWKRSRGNPRPAVRSRERSSSASP